MATERKIFGLSILCLVVQAAVCLQVSIPQKNYEYARGDNITIPCKYTPKKPDNKLVIVTWTAKSINPDEPDTIVLTSYSSVSTVDVTDTYEGRASIEEDVPTGKANLRLLSIGLQDNMDFECHVSIPGDDTGVLAATARLIVLVAPSPPLCKIQGSAEYGQNINLTCVSAEGSPTPTYSWQRRDVSNIPRPQDGRTTDKNGLLSLFNVSTETSGYYICTSANKIRSATCNVTLSVMPRNHNHHYFIDNWINYCYVTSWRSANPKSSSYLLIYTLSPVLSSPFLVFALVSPPSLLFFLPSSFLHCLLPSSPLPLSYPFSPPSFLLFSSLPFFLSSLLPPSPLPPSVHLSFLSPLASMNLRYTAGIAGAVVAAIILLIVIICCCRRRNKNKGQEDYEMGAPDAEFSDKEPQEGRGEEVRSVEPPRNAERRNEREYDRRSDYDDRRSDYNDRRSDYDDRRSDIDDRRSDYTDHRSDYDARSDNNTDRRDRYDDRRDRDYKDSGHDDRYDEPYDDRPPRVPANKPVRKDYED
ncbi:uncharacterized protein [Osmerus mordax]|uniref:uncharacterized protein isoform X1 n=1 Tax=Osmerus mordax TaxID=8014 RepID=UPI00350FB537